MPTTQAQIVSDIALLTPAEAERAREDVLALRDHWTPRNPAHPYFTLGAASYLDARSSSFAGYQEAARRSNPVLAERFGWLHTRLCTAVSEVTGGQARCDDRLALPGFHVFLYNPDTPPAPASMHYDLQYELIDWSAFGTPEPATQLSLTLTLALPASGGGLLVWNINRLEIERMTPAERRAHMDANRYAAYEPYTVGHLAIHSGHQLHQIASVKDPQAGDQRITMQAHALRVDGDWIVYW